MSTNPNTSAATVAYRDDVAGLTTHTQEILNLLDDLQVHVAWVPKYAPDPDLAVARFQVSEAKRLIEAVQRFLTFESTEGCAK